MKNKFLALVEEAGAKKDVTAFRIGDQVDIHQRILEGQKERVQVFSGTVIARRGDGLRETFTVRRIVQGEGVERIFPLHSPKIAKIEVKRTGQVRRGEGFFLPHPGGQGTRLRERRKGPATTEASGVADGKSGRGKAQSSIATDEREGAKTSR